MKRSITIAAAIAALAIPARASAEYSPPDQIPQSAQCGSGAGSGAFGAFGEKGDVRHDFRGGADGYQTGLNNSALCGNRQKLTRSENRGAAWGRPLSLFGLKLRFDRLTADLGRPPTGFGRARVQVAG